MKKNEEQLLREAIKLVLSESMASVNLRKTIDAIKKRRTSSTSSSSKSSFGGGGYGGYGGGYGYGYGYGDYGWGSPWGYLSRDSSLAKSFQSSGIKPKELYAAAKENELDLSKIDKAELEKILMSYIDSKIESGNLKQQETEKSVDPNTTLDSSEKVDGAESTDGSGDGFGDGFGTT